MSDTAGYWQEELLTDGVLSRRFWAWVIDALLIMAIVAALWVVLLIFGFMTLGLGLPLLNFVPVVPLAYNFLFVASPAAATPGQQVLGLIVLRNDDLGRPTPLQALLWTIGFYVTLAAGAIWLCVAFFTVRRRALHDLLGNVVVVRRRALVSHRPS
ncbi:MAG: RDD family protein [Acidisphaera sp.]|nr:RDD family protein [Acidisphaera sp.]